MLITAKDVTETQKLLGFLNRRGVELPWSTDLRFIARVNKDGTVLGVVAYNGFVGCVCAMHCAGDGNWVSREFIKAAFDYPFNKCGMVSIIATMSSTNLRAQKLDKHFGFEDFAVVPRGWDGTEDLLVLKMDKDKCRWLGEKVNEQQAT